MKEFDVLRWLRRLRDSRYEEEAGLTPEQKLLSARAQAESFRATLARPKRPSESGPG